MSASATVDGATEDAEIRCALSFKLLGVDNTGQRRDMRNPSGDASVMMGAFVAGGFALTLLHRHDIRVGIASGMYLQHFVREAAKRIEFFLSVVYLCYWAPFHYAASGAHRRVQAR